MAIKAYASNNYFILEDTVTGEIQRRLKYLVTVKKVKADATYDFWDSINSYKRVEFADLADSAGAAWASVAVWEDYANANTGLGDPTTIVTSLADLKKREDAAHVSGDFGIMALAVANEAAINLSGTDGDNTPIRVKRDGTVYTLADSNFYSSTIVIDDNYTAFERRISYNPATRLYSIAFYVPGTNTVGVPVGTIVFPEEVNTTFLSDIWSKMLNAGTEEAVAIGNFSRFAVGGKAVIAETYIPAYSADEAVMAAFDLSTGRLLVQDDKIEQAQATKTVSTTSTAFVNSTTIDMRGFAAISIVPKVTSTGGTYAEYKIQWSFDANEWFDETIDTNGAPASDESLVAQNTMIRRFDSNAAVTDIRAAVTLDKRARYLRISARSEAAATNVTTDFLYQLMK